MKKFNFDFMKNKTSLIKEINISFTQSQNKSKKENEDTNNKQNLSQVEISFWKKNIQQLEEQYNSLKSFNKFKERQLYLLKCQLNSEDSKNCEIIQKKMENEQNLKKMKEKFGEIERKLNAQLSNLKSMNNQIGEFTLKKYKIKNEIGWLRNIIEKASNDKKNKKSPISFNKIDTLEINNQYKGLMTTTHGEMCRSRLGNKLLLSLNVDEINSHQVFDRMNLAYPVLKRKKIQFSYFGDTFNTKKLGKKKINLSDFNKFKVAGLPDGVQTVV